jgi:predicted nucleotidyltransferase
MRRESCGGFFWIDDIDLWIEFFRASQKAKPWSDLDLAIKAESALDWKLLEEIKETFQQSELPFRVDVLDWNDITESFRKAIETNGFEVLT